MNDHTRVHEYVQTQGLAARLIAPQTPMPTVPLAAVALGVAEGQIVKTIVFEVKKGFEGKNGHGSVAVAIVTGDARVDRAKVAAVLSLPTLKLASPETVAAVIGYEVGGVPPVAHVSSVPVVVDPRVLEHEKVYGGGGDDFHMLEIAPHDIVRLTNAVVADVILTADVAPAAS
jgi:prolyl-tRNA editing enzyme YbaK/EbsC (Cys-tRNA(Pro) deacylase)